MVGESCAQNKSEYNSVEQIRPWEQTGSFSDLGIILSPSALVYVEEIFAKHPDTGVCRFMARDGGCSGKKYDVKLSESVEDAAEVTILEKLVGEGRALKVTVCKKSLNLLKNCFIDHKRSEVDEKFIFLNPNSKSSCGCGESFS